MPEKKDSGKAYPQFEIDKKTWAEFKKACKADDSDASKTLRKFIRRTVVAYQQSEPD